jgi:putative tryptophan/tyrosine transport system substrate-binding protein
MWLSIIGLLITLILPMVPRATNAQQVTKVYRIGWLSSGNPPSGPTPNFEAFQQGLRDLGYVEGQHFVMERRYAEGKLDRLPDLAAELVRLHVDIIVTGGSTPATLAAKQATSTIPILMAGLGTDPVEAGLVASLARPGGNVTGMTASDSEGWGKRLELLKEAVPRLARVALLWNPANLGNLFCLREVQAATLRMGVQLHLLEMRDTNAFEPPFAEIAREPPDALLICRGDQTAAYGRPIADFAVRSHLPTMTSLREYVQAGVLMSYGLSLPAQWRRAAYYVDKILKGTKPADLPVERPMKFELVINLKTAEALGLSIPPSILFQADEVIK